MLLHSVSYVELDGSWRGTFECSETFALFSPRVENVRVSILCTTQRNLLTIYVVYTRTGRVVPCRMRRVHQVRNQALFGSLLIFVLARFVRLFDQSCRSWQPSLALSLASSEGASNAELGSEALDTVGLVQILLHHDLETGGATLPGGNDGPCEEELPNLRRVSYVRSRMGRVRV